ncbi:6-phosphogluconolactonase [Rhodovulum sp. PH10]|uniref:6-phosphogluconolactonase n=1 Tax=Rhodovulum sp. PH10 TaxID=1187851 RepID=UPI00058E4DE4|nr:6-phosphogluconolactonase [Rhodovulum sp. PH10]
MKAEDLVVLDDKTALVEAAAERIAAALENVGERGAVCLTGGSTILPVYRRLAEAPYRARIPVARLHWFFGDERFVPADDSRSNARQARETLLEPLGVPAERIHAVPTDVKSLEAAAKAYQDDLVRFYASRHGGSAGACARALDPQKPLFDLVLMGLGGDGHTASLFPGKPAVEVTDRLVVGVPEAGLAPFVPRVSLTLPALASTKAMLFVVSGADKRDPLARILAGEDLPAGRAHANGAFTVLADRAAAPDPPPASKDLS